MDGANVSSIVASRKNSLANANNHVETHEDVVFLNIRKPLPTPTSVRDDSHVSRSNHSNKAAKKRRSSSTKRDPSGSFCTLRAVRTADEDGQIRSEFLAEDPDICELEEKARRSSIQRQSYNVALMNRLVDSYKDEKRADATRARGGSQDGATLLGRSSAHTNDLNGYCTVRQIQAGTLERLVDSLAGIAPNDELQIDNSNAHTLLATYRKYSSCCEVLAAILRRCAIAASASGVEAEQMIEAYTAVLLLWIKTYPEDFLLGADTSTITSASTSTSNSNSNNTNTNTATSTNGNVTASSSGHGVHVRHLIHSLTSIQHRHSSTTNSSESDRSSRNSIQKPLSQSMFASLLPLVRHDVLETFAQFERVNKHEKFVKTMRRLRDWLTKVLQATVESLSQSGEVRPVTGSKVPPRVAPKPNVIRKDSGATFEPGVLANRATLTTPVPNASRPPSIASIAPETTSHQFGSVESVVGLPPAESLIKRLLYFSPERFARALTLIDARLFRALRLYECLGSVWSQPLEVRTHRAISVMRTVAQFNKLVQLIQSSVLDDTNWGTRTEQQRAEIIEFWITVAQHLRTLKNFSSLKATVTSLTSTSLYRLNRHWSKVSKQHRDTLSELERLVSEDNNHVLTRELLLKEGAAKLPVSDGDSSLNDSDRSQAVRPVLAQFGTIPYLGLFLTDLVFIHAALNDYVEVDVHSPQKAHDTHSQNGGVYTQASGVNNSPKNGNRGASPIGTTGHTNPAAATPVHAPQANNGVTKRKLINFEKCRREFEVLARIRLLQSSTTLYLQNLPLDAEFDAFYSQFYTPATKQDQLSPSNGPKKDATDNQLRRDHAVVSHGIPIRLLSEDECYKVSLQLEKTIVHRSASISNLPAGEVAGQTQTQARAPGGAALAPFFNISTNCAEAFRTRADAAERAGLARAAPESTRTADGSQTPRGPAMTLVPISLDGHETEISPVLVNGLPGAITSTPGVAGHTPKVGANGISPMHRKAKSSDERTVLLRSLSSSFSIALNDREEATTRNVRVKIDLDHPVANGLPGSGHGDHAHTTRPAPHHHGALTVHTGGRPRPHSPAFNTTSKSHSDQVSSVNFNSLRANAHSKTLRDSHDLRHVATILNQFQTSAQFVDYKTIQIMNSDRKAHVVRKILAKFNLDAVADANEYLDFCAANFDLVQLLNDGSEVLIGDNTNVFYALKSQPSRADANGLTSPGSDYVLALRFK